MTVHGDDFTSCGTTEDLAWLQRCFEKKFEVTTTVLGPEKAQALEVRILNRIIRWTESGIAYEPDPRQSEIAIKDLGLDADRTKAAGIPGIKEQMTHALSWRRSQSLWPLPMHLSTAPSPRG